MSHEIGLSLKTISHLYIPFVLPADTLKLFLVFLIVIPVSNISVVFFKFQIYFFSKPEAVVVVKGAVVTAVTKALSTT